MRIDGKIQYYGLASWDCFRVPPSHPLYVSLQEVVEVAMAAGGKKHGFRAVQVPVRCFEYQLKGVLGSGREVKDMAAPL
jgi:hypothetical protein